MLSLQQTKKLAKKLKASEYIVLREFLQERLV